MTSTRRRLLAAALAVVLAFWLWGKLKPPKDDRAYLLSLPSTVASMAERKQVAEIKRFISRSYADKSGRNYEDLSRMLMAQLLAGGEISVYTLGPQVELDLERGTPWARLMFRAALARGPRNPGALDLIPESASYYNFTLELEKGSDGWLVMNAEWVPV